MDEEISKAYVMQEHHSNPATRHLANTSSAHSMEGERHNPLIFQILKMY
jgi:hypothetical protein